jgi:hypothetical protein
MSLQLDIPHLDLSEEEAQQRFDQLQSKLVSMWNTIDDLDENTGEHSVVVVPSLTVDFAALQGPLLQAYEERFLFLLLLLRQPRTRLIYVTSQPIHQNVIDYYLGMLPGVIMSHARQRLFTLAPHDGASQPLSIKLLQRPRLLQRLRDLIPSRDHAHLVTFNTTRHERDLALCLGIPLYGADPRFQQLGSKSGCRELFRETGVPYPIGSEDLRSLDDIVDTLAELVQAEPGIVEAMIKHNDGVSGEGNAIVDLAGVDGTNRDAIVGRLRNLHVAASDVTADDFLREFADVGGVVEQRIDGETMTSPSVQLRITPRGDVEILSTHDQWLGGAEQQKYVGCIFPADSEYASLLIDYAGKVGQRLAELGVIGRLAIDFVCARQSDGWKAYAIELNLRKGGTTHPFQTLQFLTDGEYDTHRNEFTIGGQRKYYVATDALISESYRVFTPDDLFDVAVLNDLHYDQTRQAGVIFHMLSAIGDYGRLGMTAIANSPADARALYDRTVRSLDAAAQAALDTKLQLPS